MKPFDEDGWVEMADEELEALESAFWADPVIVIDYP